MVNNFRLLALLLCLILPGIVLAEVRLTLRVDKKITVLGEPLLVKLMAEDAREPLSSISLDKLKQNFNVYGISSSVQTQNKKSRSVSSETLTLTLYPLRSGKFQLPAFIYRGKSTPPLLVTVLESDKQTSRVLIKTALDNANPQVRQADTLTLDIYDDGSLQWSAPREIVAAAAHQRPLAASQREETVEGIRYTVHHYAWALMPLREGGMTVEFPMLDAMKFGTRLRYAVAPLWINATAVPAYLPVHVPIGKIQLTMEPLPAENALYRPVNWTFEVQGSGISIEGMSKLLAGIRGNEAMRFYPPVISIAGKERPTSARQTLRVTLPFVPLQTGVQQLPEISLPYYDPASVRLESVLVPPASVVVFNPLWLTVQKIALGLMLLLGVTAMVYGLFKQLIKILKRRKSLFAISSAASAKELQQALLKFDISSLTVPSLTLQQWLQRMQSIYVIDGQLAVIVQQLETAQYGVYETDKEISRLSLEAGNILKKLPLRKKEKFSSRGKSLFWRLIQLQPQLNGE